MEKIIQEKWTQALKDLTENDSRREALAMATQVVLTSMNPDVADIGRVKGSLNVLIRRGLGRWTGDWLLESFRRDTLEKVVPCLEELESRYQEYISQGSAYMESTGWVITAFQDVIQRTHTRFTTARNMAILFDERIRDAHKDPTEVSALEISSRLLSEFLSVLAIQLPPSFDQVAYLYFETIFRQYEQQEESQMAMIPRYPFVHEKENYSDAEKFNTQSIDEEMDSDTKQIYTIGEDRTTALNNNSQKKQLIGKKRRKIMQDGRFAIDLFTDEIDDDFVEQIFYEEGQTKNGADSCHDARFDNNEIEKEGFMKVYLDLCQQLEDIGFAGHMTDVVTRMLYEKVEGKIFGSFKKKWDVPTLESGKNWMSSVVLPFLRRTLLRKNPSKSYLNRPSSAEAAASKRYKVWASTLEFYFFKTFGDLRTKEIFDIIVEHPVTSPAILDLKTCINWTGQREQLQNAILVAIDKRLLHPGAKTTDIIEFYICAIRYLRMIDPSGIMLGHTSRKINQYLRTRDDTMRAIVSCIVDDSLGLLTTNAPDGLSANNVEADDEDSDDDTWVPEPVNAGPDLSSARRRMADIISVLANIYDNNDRFIKEFQVYLADRLLQAVDFNVDRELRQLELLKLRFGEQDVQHCEVMLADIAESKRVNVNIQSRSQGIPVSATIASRYYWPEIEDEAIKMPDPFRELLESYKAAFAITKPAQKLSLFPSLGLVELELELQDRTLEFKVSPIHAAIIHAFEEQDTWTLDSIANRLQSDEDVLESKIQFWIREGVLQETGRLQYELVENLPSTSLTNSFTQ